jgi:hypothetical protein
MPVTNDPDDYWGKAVTLLTGYAMPSRKTLFDKLKSKEGIPLFRMDIQSMDMRAVAPEDFTAISGWNTHDGEDYDLAFYTAGGNGAHDGGVQMHRARIVFIGIPSVDGKGHLLDTGETWEAGAFTGHYGDEWDLGPLSQYLGGPKAALNGLLGGTTRDVSFSGLDVADAEAVDLASFERTAQAFDRATQFFIDHAKTLEGWENSIGSEQSAWRGQAAGVFWHLIHQLHKNYDSYVDQLGGTDYQSKNQMQSGYRPKSLFGDSLAGAQQNLITQAKALQDAWNTWSQTYFYDPHRMLLTALDELTKWVIANNVPYIQSHSNMSYAPTYSTTDQFQDNSPYGPLNDINTFKKLAEKVVTDWNTHVDTDLGTPAQTVISTLGNDWSDAGGDFDDPLTTKDTTTLSESYQTEAAEIAQEKADQNQQDLNDSLDGLGDDLNNGLDGLGDNLNDLGDGLGDNLNGLGDNLNNLGDGLGDNLNNLGDGLGDNLNGLGDNLNNLGNGLGDSLNGLGGPGPDTNLNGDGPPADLSNLRTLSTALNGPGGPLGGDPGGGPGMPLPLTNSLLGGPNGTPPPVSLNGGLNLPNNRVDSLTGPGGGTTKLNADGSLETTFPDGSKSVVNPADGTVTTTTPDGNSTTSPLNSGGSFKNPDGSTTTLNPDGTLTTKSPDGTSTTINPDTGATTTTNPDGSTTTSNLNPQVGSFSTPGGGTSHLNPDGSLTNTLPDGTQETINPTNHTVTTTTPDGHTTTSQLNTGDAFKNPDGSTTTLNPDGTLTTKFPDGTIDTVNPATGDLNTTSPDGTQHTSNLNPPGIDGLPDPKDLTNNLNNPPSDLDVDHQLPDSLNLNSLGNSGNLPGGGLPDSTSLLNSGGVGGGGTGGGLNGFGDPSLDDFEDYDSTPFGGGPLGGTSNDLSALMDGQQAQQGPSGTPLNPMSGGGGGGGMGGGGGGMGGGGGGGSNNNERVRNVLGGETGGASLRRTSSRGVPEEGEDVVLSRSGRPTTSSGSPMYPGGGGHGGGQGDQSTSSGDRERAGWVPEDDDVWGTEGEGGAPAVIG